jgi:hypothetical protein
MTNVIIAKINNNRTINSNAPVVLKNVTNAVGGVSRLDHLLDVVPTGETAGATLVYDSDTDKYIVKKLDLADVTGNLDGGIF